MKTKHHFHRSFLATKWVCKKVFFIETWQYLHRPRGAHGVSTSRASECFQLQNLIVAFFIALVSGRRLRYCPLSKNNFSAPAWSPAHQYLSSLWVAKGSKAPLDESLFSHPAGTRPMAFFKISPKILKVTVVRNKIPQNVFSCKTSLAWYPLLSLIFGLRMFQLSC